MGRHAAGIEPLPDLQWAFEEDGGAAACRVECPAAEPEEVLVWTASSPTRDFRAARWSAAAAGRDGDAWQFTLPQPAAGFAAGLIELRFPREPIPLMLTTGVKVVSS